jgi:Kef-type K+ transport system membrane component KefB
VDQSDLLLTVALVLVAAKLGGVTSRRFGLPEVFGKLLVGLLLGPAVLGLVHTDESLNALADIGIILLMFIAGLETDVVQMRRVGVAALLAACGGVALPMIAGAGLGIAFGMSAKEAIFLGTVLTATSVGITAQTLTELGRLRSREGSAILAAAVIDDVMGVVVLSVVLAFETGGDPAIPLIKMAAFVPIAIGVGLFIVPIVINRILHLHEGETRTAIVIGIALAFAWASEHLGGLAAVSGAYLAGLMIARTEIAPHATESMNQLAHAFFIPVFFVVVGLKMDSSALRDEPVFAACLIVVAITTKIIGSGAGALVGGFRMDNAIKVGFGMVSRGEVALVVAVIGLDHGLVTESTFSTVILMTLATTLAAPLLLKWAYRGRPAYDHAQDRIPAGAGAGATLVAAEVRDV